MLLITHSGTFHYDEVLATAILKRIYPEAELVRTRDPEIIKKGDVVYDVGGVLDPSHGRFDHHQSTFSETFSPEHRVPLSSAGLIYKYFHEQLFSLFDFSRENPLYEKIYQKVYNEFFLYADAGDNGYNIFGEIIPRTMANVVALYNVYTTKDIENSQEFKNRRFRDALEVVSKDLENYLQFIFKDYLVSYGSVREEILQLEGPIYYTELTPSVDLIFEVDEDLGKKIQLVVFKNKHDYRVLSLRVRRGDFTSRCPLPSSWRGLAQPELQKVSGIPSIIFVHRSGFTGGAKKLEDALTMCDAALKENGIAGSDVGSKPSMTQEKTLSKDTR